ncbi:hypothetical protein CISIN_1g047169mg [Citrus sinensis]|uniref:Uncharacterized protein n=1 Tax=Citrus sinensis TaxID=2711 RepID=A0A067F4R3_CITSI|nr:hypothetical protein CISIN_1g047169mg [Citrus sinensis]
MHDKLEDCVACFNLTHFFKDNFIFFILLSLISFLIKKRRRSYSIKSTLLILLNYIERIKSTARLDIIRLKFYEWININQKDIYIKNSLI